MQLRVQRGSGYYYIKNFDEDFNDRQGIVKVKATYTFYDKQGNSQDAQLYCVHDNGKIMTLFDNDEKLIKTFNDVFIGKKQNISFEQALNSLYNPFEGNWGSSNLKGGLQYF